MLLLAPDGVRLRQARRMLDLLPVRAFLALERDGAGAGAGSPVWRAPSGPVPLSLREVLDYVRPGGELPGEAPSRRESAATDLDLDPYPAGQDAPNFLLPAMLKPAGKRALDLLFDWPCLAPAHLGELLGVKQTRRFQTLEGLRGLDLAASLVVEGRRLLALTDRGLALLARRDRSAVGAARRRWSVAPLDPAASLTWRNLSGSRSIQLLRNLEHTQAVHWFLAALAGQCRAQGWEAAQFDPPRRASRFFRHDGALHSVRPDAFGVSRRAGRELPFFLDRAHRAGRPGGNYQDPAVTLLLPGRTAHPLGPPPHPASCPALAMGNPVQSRPGPAARHSTPSLTISPVTDSANTPANSRPPGPRESLAASSFDIAHIAPSADGNQAPVWRLTTAHRPPIYPNGAKPISSVDPSSHLRGLHAFHSLSIGGFRINHLNTAQRLQRPCHLRVAVFFSVLYATGTLCHQFGECCLIPTEICFPNRQNPAFRLVLALSDAVQGGPGFRHFISGCHFSIVEIRH